MKSKHSEAEFAKRMSDLGIEAAIISVNGKMRLMVCPEKLNSKETVPYAVLAISAMASRHARDETWANELLDWFMNSDMKITRPIQ